jgi:hypothetical protein
LIILEAWSAKQILAYPLTLLNLSYIFNIQAFLLQNLKREFNMRVFSRLAVTIIFVAGLCLAAGAGDFEYKEYKVQRGDTLWDIAQQELEDPFNWPIVWRENPQIQNPDRIYPGQIIRIPLSLLKQPEMVPEVRPEPVAKAEEPAPPPPPPVEVGPVATPLEVKTDITEITAIDIRRSGYISMELPRDGEIVDAPTNRELLGTQDEMYIKRIVEKKEVPEPFHVGEKFYIIRNGGKVNHPQTGKFMGYLIRILGIAEVERVGEEDVTARVTTFYDQIERGDLLDDYYDVQPLFLTGEPRKPEVEGYVVATTNMRFLNSNVDVAHIDRGAKDGLQPGDVVATLWEDSLDRGNGVLRVISTRDETATTIVLYDDYEVGIGHGVASCAKVLGCPSLD